MTSKAVYLVVETTNYYILEEGTEADVHDWKKLYNKQGYGVARMVWEAEKDIKPVTYSAPEGECLDKYLKENT